MAHPIESIPTPPRGDFLSEKRQNPVHKTEVTYEDETEHALIREHKIKMRDGSRYLFSEVLPKHPTIDVPFVRTPAWTTAHDDGVERYYALALAELGIPAFSISPQQNLLRRGYMNKSSHDYIEASRHIAGSIGLNRDHMMTGGSSRGGDHSLTMAAVADAHGVEVDYFDSLAACMPLGLFNRQFKEQAAKLTGEPGSLVRQITRGPLGYVGVLARTVTLHPVEALQQGKEVITLIDGSVGRLTRKLPPDAYGVAQQFVGDGLAFDSHWPDVLSPFQNVYQFYDDGTHFDCVSEEQLGYSLERVAHVRDGIISGAVGARALHDMVAIGNPVFQREPEPDRHLRVV